MDARITQLLRSGKEITLVDFSHLGESDAIALAERYRDYALANKKSGLLVVVDVTGTASTPSVFQAMKQTSLAIENMVHTRYVVGVDGVKKMLLTFYNNAVKKSAIPVSTVSEAIDRLVKSEKVYN